MLTILLDQDAVETAIVNYISQDELNVDLTDREVSIKLVMGRGDNGLRAEVNIAAADSPSVTTSAPVSENDVDVESATADEPEDSAEEPVIGPFD